MGFVLSHPLASSGGSDNAAANGCCCCCSYADGDLYLRKNTCVLNDLGGNGWDRQLRGRVYA